MTANPEAFVPIRVAQQPTDTTCGPTCLHALYRHYGLDNSLQSVIDEIPSLKGGGTLAVNLAIHGLEHGFSARIYTYNLNVFDPTWFVDGKGVDIAERLRGQLRIRRDRRRLSAIRTYLRYLELGGEMAYRELSNDLIRGYLARGVPLLTGLSATYLYGCAREKDNEYNDFEGEPQGHFVVLNGYNRKKKCVQVADPLYDNPRFNSNVYEVSMDRLKNAIMLGIMTYDANLLVLRPINEKTTKGR